MNRHFASSCTVTLDCAIKVTDLDNYPGQVSACGQC